MAAIDGKIIFTRSDCYKAAKKMTPAGIVVHSTGANNPYLSRYVQPDDGKIGDNKYDNDFNNPGVDVCVHAFIGKDKDGNVKCYQTLPFDYCCWGVGSGNLGSYNYDPAYIQFEMCEDGLTDKTYCKSCYDKAVEFCAYICTRYKIPVKNIVSHHEAYEKGMGSNHIDPDNWWGKSGYTMTGFRNAVTEKINEKPVMDKDGYKEGSSTIGVLSLKELLLIAKKLGINKYGMDKNRIFGKGTLNAVNYLLDKWGYKQNGVAGENFISRLHTEIDQKL
ncbi:MAG: N-acetylmuramoyl-L-alanine amidase family protein [Porcipelethomonas sp.]